MLRIYFTAVHLGRRFGLGGSCWVAEVGVTTKIQSCDGAVAVVDAVRNVGSLIL